MNPEEPDLYESDRKRTERALRAIGAANQATARRYIEDGRILCDNKPSTSAQKAEVVRLLDAESNGKPFLELQEEDLRGVLRVLYYTRAYDAENRLLVAEYAFSEDGGDTWTAQRLTKVSFDGDLGLHPYGGAFIGDYNGIDVVAGEIYARFATTVTGRAEIAVAHLTRAYRAT